MTETRNAYSGMPADLSNIGECATQLAAIREANLDHHEELIRAASHAGAEIIGLGELFAAPYFALGRHEFWRELAEDTLEGLTVQRMKRVARENKILIVAPIYEYDAGTRSRFNTAVLIDEKGEVLGRYRKVHIPHGSNERASFDEAFYYSASDGKLDNGSANISSNPYFPVFETRVGRIGIAICYDRHFPGVMETLALQGAQLVFCPAVTFGSTSERMWQLEFAVDAARHKLYIAGSNRRGSEPPFGVEYFGESCFAGPAGVLPTVESQPGLVLADLDLAALKQSSDSGWDLARDARPETRSFPTTPE